MKRIAIDLTPLLPGGDNGGAKPLAIELIRHLARVAPACEFILLTNEKSHEELQPPGRLPTSSASAPHSPKTPPRFPSA